MVPKVIELGAKLIQAGIKNRAIIKKFGKDAYLEAKKHLKDLRTKQTPAQKKAETMQKGTRFNRSRTRKFIGGAGILYAGDKLLEQMTLKDESKKAIEEALLQGRQEGRIDALLRQAINEAKEASKSSKKDINKFKNLKKPLARPKLSGAGAIEKASPPLKRPKPSGAIPKARPPLKRPKIENKDYRKTGMFK